MLSTIGTITLNGVNVFASDPTYTVAGVRTARAGRRGAGRRSQRDQLQHQPEPYRVDLGSKRHGSSRCLGGILTATGGTVTMTGAWNHGIVASAGTVDTNAVIVVNGVATPNSANQAYGAFAIGEAVSQFGPSTIVLGPGSSITNHNGDQGSASTP